MVSRLDWLAISIRHVKLHVCNQSRVDCLLLLFFFFFFLAASELRFTPAIVQSSYNFGHRRKAIRALRRAMRTNAGVLRALSILFFIETAV
jgi:hypothetical protein